MTPRLLGEGQCRVVIVTRRNGATRLGQRSCGQPRLPPASEEISDREEEQITADYCKAFVCVHDGRPTEALLMPLRRGPAVTYTSSALPNTKLWHLQTVCDEWFLTATRSKF